MFLAIKFNIFAGLFKSINYSAYFCKKKAVFIKRLTRFTGWFILGICLGRLEKYCYSRAGGSIS